MPVDYAPYHHRPINELVFAGSHDAGINSGGGGEKTQKLDIAGQANAGVRLFDIRVAVRSSGLPGSGVLKAYHGKGMHKVVGGNQLMAGTWGLGLDGMLAQARAFVQGHPDEFLFLKFDHCLNWIDIAAACIARLGPVRYLNGTDLNLTTAGTLAGHVIPLFSAAGLAAIGGVRPQDGIYGIKSLYVAGGAPQDYDDNYVGLQYHGKGGTSAMNGKSDEEKINENVTKQTTIMSTGKARGGGDPRVMGMMYWTSTGFLRSIKKRDKSNWVTGGFGVEMQKLWLEGMAEHIDANLPSYMNAALFPAGPVMKRFMPNFVMIDFAKADRCQTIFDMNTLNGNMLVQLGINLGMVNAQRMQRSIQ
ncbi:hypothetical protein [Rhodanobacter panaciterrae]|nr:hypothetical protein [Rhodanobacter panaciterrae]